MPSLAEGAGLLSSVGDTAAELFISKGIPYLAKQGFEAGRYYASEAMRNPALQKKDYYRDCRFQRTCLLTTTWGSHSIILSSPAVA